MSTMTPEFAEKINRSDNLKTLLFSRMLENILLQESETCDTMAGKLDIGTDAALSLLNGAKAPAEGLEERIAEIYGLDDRSARELAEAARRSRMAAKMIAFGEFG